MTQIWIKIWEVTYSLLWAFTQYMSLFLLCCFQIEHYDWQLILVRELFSQGQDFPDLPRSNVWLCLVYFCWDRNLWEAYLNIAFCPVFTNVAAGSALIMQQDQPKSGSTRVCPGAPTSSEGSWPQPTPTTFSKSRCWRCSVDCRIINIITWPCAGLAPVIFIECYWVAVLSLQFITETFLVDSLFESSLVHHWRIHVVVTGESMHANNSRWIEFVSFRPMVVVYPVELELLRLRKLAMEDGTISKDEKKQMDEA